MRLNLCFRVLFLVLACSTLLGCNVYTLDDYKADHPLAEKGEAIMTDWYFTGGCWVPVYTFYTKDRVQYSELLGEYIERDPSMNYVGCSFVVWYDPSIIANEGAPKRHSWLDHYGYICLDQMIIPDTTPLQGTIAHIRFVALQNHFTYVEYDLIDTSQTVKWRWSESVPTTYYHALRKAKKETGKVRVLLYQSPENYFYYAVPRIDRSRLDTTYSEGKTKTRKIKCP